MTQKKDNVKTEHRGSSGGQCGEGSAPGWIGDWSPSSSCAGLSSLHIPSPACESRTCRELVRGSPTSVLKCKVQVPLSSSPHPDPRAVHLCTWGRGHIRICLTHITVTGCILWNSGLGKSRCGPASECFLSHDCRQHPCATGQRKTFPDGPHP